MKKAKTQAERDYHELVASLPCVLCDALTDVQQTGTAVHHARTEQGLSQRASHWIVAALCHDCHQGPCGVHGDRSLLRIAKLSELDLVALTFQAAMAHKACDQMTALSQARGEY